MKTYNQYSKQIPQNYPLAEPHLHNIGILSIVQRKRVLTALC